MLASPVALVTVFACPAIGAHHDYTPSPIAQTCSVSQTKHYDDKALGFMREQSWNSANAAMHAAWNSQAKCPSATRNIVWALWWNVTEAALWYYARVPLVSPYLERAASLAPAARAYAISTHQVADYNDILDRAERLRNALAIESQPHVVPVPIPEVPMYRYYGSAPLSSSCDDDSIDTVGDDGSIIEMLSGAVYRVADVDTPTSMLWLTAEEVLICGSRIINKDNDGEAVDAEKVR